MVMVTDGSGNVLSDPGDTVSAMSTRRQPDEQRLSRLLAQQYNVIARHQALACGITRSALRHRLRRGGPWRMILPGVYAADTGAMTLEQREMAALLHAGPGSVLTGPAAVRRHRLACPGAPEVDVLVRSGVRVQSAGFVRIQHTTRMPSAPWSARGILFAPLPRAVADAARTMRCFEDVQALVCEAIQRGRCTVEELIAELRTGPSAGSRLLREALAEVTTGIRSVAEGDLKRFIDRSDLERPMYNPRLYLRDGEAFRFLGIPDAWWQRAGVAAEVDSLQYHLRARDHAATVQRHNRMEAAGIHMLHFQPMSIRSGHRQILRDIRNAVAAGSMRPELPIVAVPAGERDCQAYLKAHAGALQFT
jgi:hypothetical protein